MTRHMKYLLGEIFLKVFLAITLQTTPIHKVFFPHVENEKLQRQPART
jgi:hypothetical protein